MRRLLNLFLLFVCFFCSNYIEISAYSISSSNNPGSAYTGTEGGGVSEKTYWPESSGGKSLRAIRIRIFRGTTEIKSEYYSLVEDQNNCYSSVSNVTLCETTSYNYKSVNDKTDLICTNSKDIKLGCIASNNLLKTWGVRTSDGKYLDNYLKNDNYSNLKTILMGMGYNDTNFNKNDVVIVEPATFVKCNGTNYFGTSTAMMKKNVSYNGEDTNVCYDSADSTSDGYPAGTFYYLFRSMSVALKVSPKPSYQGDNAYTGFGYFKYDVSGMGYVNPNGDLRVEIYVDGTDPKQLIISDKLTFNIRSGHGCTGAIKRKDLSTGNSGFKTENLPAGDYSVEITGKPASKNYKEKAGIDYSCRNVILTSSGATVSIPFEKGCNIEKDEKSIDGYTMSDAITLYNKYKYNGLLNTSNPTCEIVECSPQAKNLSCLSAEVASNISSTNFSCADIYTNTSGNAVVFCGNMFSLVNNLIVNGNKIKTFYGTSGEFLIKKDVDANLYQIYNEDNLPEYISAQNGISTASSKRVCYTLNGTSLPQTYRISPHEVKIYLDGEELISRETENVQSSIVDGIFNVHTNEKKYNFDLNTVYLQKISGKVLESSSSNAIPVIGLISKFKSTNGSIVFSVFYDENEFQASNENTCKYVLKPRIIDFSRDEDGKIALEFRTIDTNTPFTRPTHSNWSNGNDNSSNNLVVQEYIKNRANSFGIKSGERVDPIYRIELTPNDIKLIRDYNKSNSYDNYLTLTVNYDGEPTIRNSFLYNLEQGKIDDKILSNKLHNYKYLN